MDVITNKEIKKKVDDAGVDSKHKIWIVSYVIIGLICLAVYFLLQFHVFDLL